MATGLVTMPLLLRWLGAERYGAWRTLTDWMGYVALLELGISGAIQPLLAAVLARGDATETAGLVGTAVRAYLRVTAVMVFVGIGLAVVVTRLIPVHVDLTHELIAAACINVVGTLLIPLTVFRWLADAGQRGYMVSLMLAMQTLTVAGLAVFFAWIGWGLPGQATATLIGGGVFLIGLVWIELIRHPYLARITWPARNRGQEVALATLNRPALVFNLCARLSIFSDSIILSLILGPAAVVPYYLTQRLVLLSASYVTSVANSTWAALAELYYQGCITALNHQIRRLTLLAGIMSGGLFIPAAIANVWFVRIWVGADQYGGDGVTVLTVVFAWSQNLIAIWGWVVNGTGHVRRMIPCLLIGAGINLGISVLGTWYFGLIGPALGSATQYAIIMMIWLPLILQRQFGTPVHQIWVAALQPVILAIPYAIGLVLCVETVPPYEPNWPRWVCWLSLAGWLAAAAGGYLLLAWFLVVPGADRAEWTSRLRGWLVRR